MRLKKIVLNKDHRSYKIKKVGGYLSYPLTNLLRGLEWKKKK
ncbi:hypothetical protein ES708_23250 [subsurface metagenome]